MIRSPFTLSLPTLALGLALVGAGRSPAQAVRGEHDPGAKLEQLAAENAVLKRELRAIKEIVDGVVAREPQSGAGLKVGVVDVGVLLAKHPQRAAFEAELDGERESAKATLARKKQELDTLQQQGEETTQAAAKFKALQELYQSNFAKSEDAITLTLLADVEGAIQTFAEREGYDLILKVDRGAEQDAELESRLYRAQVASVLYRRDALDVTLPVLKHLLQATSQGAPALRGASDEDVLTRVHQVVRDFGGKVIRAEFVAVPAKLGNRGLRLEVGLPGSDLSRAAKLRDAVLVDPRISTRFGKAADSRAEISPLADGSESMVYTFTLVP